MGREEHGHALLPRKRERAALLEDAERPLDGGQQLARLDLLELEHRRAREQRVVNIEKRILRRGRDERDGAVLHELLLFVEILNFVEVEQNAPGRHQRADARDDVLHVL